MKSAVHAGMHLPPWRHRVAQEGATAWTRMLDDPNPIHHDAALVAKLGLGDRPINPGPANLAYFYNMLEACFPECETRALTARLTGNVYVGDLVEVTGEVAEVAELAEGAEGAGVSRVTGHVLARCVLRLRGGEDAPPAAVATAEVLVPSSGTGDAE